MTVTVLSSVPGAAVAEFIQATFTMIASPGAISVPGLVSGDIIISATNVNNNTTLMSANTFESIVSSNDQIVQNVGDAPSGGIPVSALFYRPL
jgi:hypothetical protein